MTDSKSSTVNSTKRQSGELIGIQYLRGIAAMMVVVFHLISQFRRMGYTGAWLPGLSSGVDVFFVISGFLMVVTTAKKDVSPISFWSKRIIRIAPLYWLITAFMTAILFTAPHVLQTGAYDRWHLFSSYLFIPSLHPVQHTMEPLVTPGWTLNYEMFFYFIFGIFLLTPIRLRFFGVVLTILFLVLLGYFFKVSQDSIPGFYTSAIMLEFVLGMFLGAAAYKNNIYNRIPRHFGVFALILGLLALVMLPDIQNHNVRALVRGPFATAVVAGMLIVEAHGPIKRSLILYEVGNASYSIYLTQIIVTSALSQGWRRLGLHELEYGLMAFGIVDVIACAIGGWVCYRLVESPLTKMLRPRGLDGARIKVVA